MSFKKIGINILRDHESGLGLRHVVYGLSVLWAIYGNSCWDTEVS